MKLKVKYFPYQPHCFAFGGFDHQMLNTLKAVNLDDEIASKLDIWSRDDSFDIIHFWGISEHAFKIIDWSKRKRIKLVGTVLLPYFDNLRSKLSYYYRYKSANQTNLIYYYSLLDTVVVLNEVQAEVLNKYYKVPKQKIHIIPNIVNEDFFSYSGMDFILKYKIENYVLCTGNVCSRKNQYNLAQACIDLNLNLVLIGNVLDGEQKYGEQLRELIRDRNHIIWINELSNDSKEYLSAYSNCLIFALPSNGETQPISALEAVVMKKPLLLQESAYAKQKYYANAVLSKSGHQKDIKEALQKALITPLIPNHYITECKAESVGEKYNKLYVKIMGM